MSMAKKNTIPRIAVRRRTSKNRIKESSSRETTASARNSPRQRLSRMASSCRRGEDLRFCFGNPGGVETTTSGGGESITGGSEGGNGGTMLSAWGWSLDDGIFGSDGMD